MWFRDAADFIGSRTGVAYSTDIATTGVLWYST